MVAIPVIFEKNGQVRVVLDLENNGVTDVSLGPDDNPKNNNVPAVEVHIYFYHVSFFSSLRLLLVI